MGSGNETRDCHALSPAGSSSMDIRASAEGFTTFLLDCVSKSPSVRDVFTYEMKSRRENVEMSAVVLPPQVHCALSEFTGPLQCPTVLFASPERLPAEEESPELKAILNQFSDSVVEDLQEEEEGVTSSVPQLGLVQLLTKETVFVGQQLLNKRRYLKQEVDFHSGQTQTCGGVTRTHADLTYVQPLSLDHARALVSFYLVGSRRLSVCLPALWVPCRTDSVENIVGFGCTFDQLNSQLRMYCIREKEMSGVGAGKKGNKMLGSVFAEYEIMSSATNPILGQQISVQFVWEDPETLLGPPPTLGTEAVLQVAVEPGKLQSMFSMFGEIQTLIRICKAVSEGWDYFLEGEEVLSGLQESLIDKVGDFVESINIPLSHSLQVSVVSPSIESTVYKPRENLDFTESLWLFVKEARSAEELQATLGAIFKALLLGKVQNITLRENSNSSLAELLRQLMKCTSVAERQMLAPKFQLILATMKTLLFMAQIGIEKLKRDLRGFLTGANVANVGQIDSFFEDQVDKEDIVAQSHHLCNLYHVVELVATLLSFRGLPILSLSAITKAAMDVYKQRPFVGFQTTPLFSVSLPRISTVLRPIIDMCKTSPPKLWCLSSKTTASWMNVMSARALTPCGQADKQFFAYEANCKDV